MATITTVPDPTTTLLDIEVLTEMVVTKLKELAGDPDDRGITTAQLITYLTHDLEVNDFPDREQEALFDALLNRRDVQSSVRYTRLMHRDVPDVELSFHLRPLSIRP